MTQRATMIKSAVFLGFFGAAACTAAPPPATPPAPATTASVQPSAAAPAPAPTATLGWKDLFEAGVAHKQAGDCASAIPLFERSRAIEARPSTDFNLADCQEKLGRIATAWALFARAESAAKERGQKGLESNAHERAAALFPRLPKLDVAVSDAVGSTSGLVIDVDGRPVPRSEWGVAVPVDPGDHVVSAIAPGKQPFSSRFSSVEATLTTVNIAPLLDSSVPDQTPPLASSSPVRVAATGARTQASSSAAATGAGAQPPSPAPSTGLSGRRVAALISGGAGLAAIGVGAAFGVLAIDRNGAWKSQTAKHCQPGGDCDSLESVKLIRGIESDRAAFGAVSTVGFGVAAVGIAGAVVLWLTGAPARQSPVSVHVAPVPLDRGAAGVLTGTF